MGGVLSGLDRVARGDLDLRGQRVGLLMHPASVDRRLRRADRVLTEAGATIAVLFGPEHGLDAAAQDLEPVASSVKERDARDSDPVGALAGEPRQGSLGGLPVISLYGDSAACLAPRPEMLEGLDALVVDLQDVGSRYYTYVWTATFALRVAARAGVPVIALDRPNPLGGQVVEGRPQRPGYLSFVGLRPVAVRHGMTLGELLVMAQREEGLDDECLRVVRMEGWERHMDFEATGLPWVLPSPNMPTVETAFVYPGACLFEGTLWSEGRGTTRPFEIVGAPGTEGEALVRAMGPVPGARLRPLTFVPTFQKHAGMACGGVQVHVDDRRTFRATETYVRLLRAMLEGRDPAQSPWRQEPYEHEVERPALDLLSGGPELRQRLSLGRDVEDWLADERAGAEAFRDARAPYLLYEGA
ncbi:MAG: DUF1343 domain-containing protein [Myxococcota bacterium]